MTTTAFGLCMGCMELLGDYIVCPHCGYDNSTPYDKDYLKPESLIGGRYIVGRVVRKNGEGPTYLGYDNNTHQRVWIKEYFPPNLSVRDVLTGDVRPREGCDAQYKALLSDFMDVCNEVKRLGITEPVIPIEDVICEHGTIYAVYKHLPVIALETWLVQQGGKLPVAEARELILPLLNTLSNIHARGEIHRGISPYTVYIDKAGKLYLWDFCMSATRTGASELTAELFNGYSAPEQYIPNGWQGTWTDVYGAAALFYRMVSGFVPPKSTLVGEQRPLAPLVDLVMDLPPNISDAVSEAMNPIAERRTQEIGAFVSRLIQTDLTNTAIYDSSVVNEVKKQREEKRALQAEKRRRSKYIGLGLLVTVLALGIGIWVIMATYFPWMLQSDRPAARPDTDESSQESSAQDPDGQTDQAMPNFVGLALDQVQQDAAYEDRFLFNVVEDYNSQFEPGVIFDQAPRYGVPVQDGRNVILYVSKGKQMITMPDLVGLTREDAIQALQLACGEIELPPYSTYNKYTPEAEPGTVVSTSPAAGEEFDPRDARINIFFMPEVSELPSSSSGDTGNSQGSAGGGNERDNSRLTVDEFMSQFNS